MARRTYVTLGVFSVVGACVLACSGNVSNVDPVDAGSDADWIPDVSRPDGRVDRDAVADARIEASADAAPDAARDASPDAQDGAVDARRDAPASDGGACVPQAVANPLVAVPAYKPYAKLAACTDAQLTSFYTACVDANATSTTCAAWENDAGNSACDSCIVTPGTNAGWGPFVVIALRDIPFNIAGCFGITLNEGTSTTGCGAARWTLDRCQRAACPMANCFADPNNPTPAEQQAYEQCRTAALTTSCAAPAQDMDTKCAALGLDSATPLTNQTCPLGANVPLQQLTLAITRTFCGGATGDAGGGG